MCAAVRTLLISDLHLGDPFRRDVLRRSAPRERLLAALGDVERLVLLGDTLEVRSGARGLAAAEPVLRAIGEALGPQREVIVVPGNHDARLARRWILDQGRQLGLANRVDPAASRPLSQVLSWLAPARTEVSYPGVWVADGVWATHGHYLDRHLVPESAIGLRRRGVRGDGVGAAGAAGALPIDYERRRGRRRGGDDGVGDALRSPARALGRLAKKGVVSVVPGLLLRSGLAPVTAEVLGLQMR